MRPDKKTILLWFFIVLKFALQYLLIGPEYELHRDEFLHLDQANHMDWGYLSVPPVTSWISSVIQFLGNGTFWVKFFPALFGALTLYVVWKTIEELNGNLFALLLGATAVTFSAILRINTLFQPNSLDILCWTFLYFTVVKYLDTENKNWLLASALTFAIGFLNKYNIIFLILGLVPAMLLTRHRSVFWNPTFYYGILVVLFFIAPNLLWQYNNDFPVFGHLDNLSKTQLVNIRLSDFLRDQLLFFSGSIFVLLAAFISFFTYPPFKKFSVIFWSFIFTFLLFIYLKAKGYYAIGLYPVLLAFGAVYLEHLLQNGWKRWLRPAAVAIIVLTFIPFIKYVFPVLPPEVIQQNATKYKTLGLLRWEDGKDHSMPQDFADMLGWKELTRKVDSLYDEIGDHRHTLVLCDNYGQAGAINYYSRHTGILAVSFNADYINWFPLDDEIREVILVKDNTDKDIARTEERKLFKSVALSDSITHPQAREHGTRIYVLKEATVSVNDVLLKEIDDYKTVTE